MMICRGFALQDSASDPNGCCKSGLKQLVTSIANYAGDPAHVITGGSDVPSRATAECRNRD